MNTAPHVTHNTAQNRFECTMQGHLCVADYRLEDSPGRRVMHLTHTRVPEALAGRGIAAHLVTAALAHARHIGAKVNPVCSYVAAYMRRHPETQDLLN